MPPRPRGSPSSANANIDSSDGNLYFGSWGANNNYRFTGSMDEVKVFDGKLSGDEVNTLYNIESGHVKLDGAALNTTEDSAIVIDVLANDVDVDGGALTITDAGTATDAHGHVAGTTEIVEVDGKQQIRFTPNDSLDTLNEGDSKTIRFNYTVSDDQGETSRAEVAVNVTGLDNDLAITDMHGTSRSERLTGTDEQERIWGHEGNDTINAGDGDDTIIGGAGSDYFNGGEGGGWTDAIDLSVTATADPDNPWTVEVDGVQLQYELASGALELNPDTSGVITFGDGTEIAFDGLEKIEW